MRPCHKQFINIDHVLRKIIVSVIIWLSPAFMAVAQYVVEDKASVHSTRYDWSGLACSITSPSKTAYDRAYDIYRWICENISYDTSYSIYTADETYEQRRGVCQGYSELFYRLGEAVGLKAELVSGTSKNYRGEISNNGHMWLFVYTGGSQGILVDPTWGAGYVNNGEFTRCPTDEWFDAAPEWMIYSHYPSDAQYQFLSRPVSFEVFSRLPYYTPVYAKYGYDGSAVLNASLSGRVTAMPEFYATVIDSHADIVKIPLEKTLHVGTYYEFCFRPKNGARLYVSNGKCLYKDCVIGNGVCKLRFMPRSEGQLSVGVQHESRLTSMIRYDVARPTEAEIDALEAEDPLFSPRLTGLPNFNPDAIKRCGIDARKLLSAVKKNGIRQLPAIYTGVRCAIKVMPYNGVLRAGEKYTFALSPGDGLRWAVINGDKWYYEFDRTAIGGNVIITVPSAGRGVLKLSARIDADKETYWTVLEYKVE